MADSQEMSAEQTSPPRGGDEQQPPKRRKKDEVRSRVSRACDRCKRKKIRCSGKQPCTLCVQASLSCEFTAAYNRGRLPSVLPDDSVQYASEFSLKQIVPDSLDHSDQLIEGRRANYPGMELLLQASLPSPPVDQHSGTQSESVPTGHMQRPFQERLDSRMPSSRNSPEPSQTDLQGHYVGPSSGVSFLLRVQKKLHQKVSFSQNSSIFTFGDAPLPEFNPSFFILPARSDAEKLVARYFDFAVPTHRFLHRPTVEAWLEEFYENLGVMRQKDGARERTAVLFMVMAQAKDYMSNQGSSPADTSARYFQAADHQLSTETGEIRLTSVQARLCQCFYLLSQSRVNHCWSLFGTTAHLILAIGIHRKRRVETSNGFDLIELECRKRVFWCAYSLDNYLSAALGRPRTFHDDDIDQDFPTCINDSDLSSHKINPSSSKAQSIMMAPVAHARLSRIVSNILRDLYSIRTPSPSARVSLTSKYSADLLSWREGLSRFLGADGIDPSLLLPLYQRQRNVLNLAYHHALILVHRPFLLGNFASLSNKISRQRGTLGTPDMDKSVSDCLEAAMNIVGIVNELAEGKQIFRAYWFTQYFAFCAVVVLYVYTTQQRNAPQEKYLSYFQAAEKCQSQIRSMAEKESLAQRYSVVLEELRLEAVKQTRGYRESQNANFSTTYIARSQNMNHIHDGTNVSGASMLDTSRLDFSMANETSGSDGPNGATPSSLMAELTDWSSFNSLVTAGMANLDFLFPEEQNLQWDLGAPTDVDGMLLP